jgi:Tol biopolymer transport system component
LYAINVVDGSMREVLSSDALIGRPVWSPEGDTIMITLGDVNTHRRQWWSVSYPQGKLKRITNDLSNYDLILDATRDGLGQ